ncbi:MAG: ABC transporter ATP-binding protein [Chloroflexia bacterium]
MVNTKVDSKADAVVSQSAPANSKAGAPAIVFENVSKRFPGATLPAIDNVYLEVEPGSFVVLFGPSGCGKTTLMRMVNRLHEHDSGRVLVEGQEARSFKVTDLRRRIGYVIQSTGLFPHMTVAENIATVPNLLGWDKAHIDKRIDELLELIGLSPKEYKRRYPAQLSGGQQQRVGLARAMAADPSILLMDEPFAAIDNITRRRLQDELLRIQSMVRKTILFVTHDIEEAIRLADKIVIMRQGKIVQYDTPLHILSNPADAFVADLVGSDDVLRRLSLLSVSSVMTPLTNAQASVNVSRLHSTATVREALGLLLSSDSDTLVITDVDDRVVGTLNLDAIRLATHTD